MEQKKKKKKKKKSQAYILHGLGRPQMKNNDDKTT